MDASTESAAATGQPAPADPPSAFDGDAATLARLRDGDRIVFQTLLRPLLPSLLGLARRLVRDPHWAEDLVQETLVRAFQGVHGFRGDCSLRTWLLTIQVRLAGQPQRWQGRSPERGIEAARPPIPDAMPDTMTAGPEQTCSERELTARLDEAMERLTLRQRTALHLRAAEGLDYRAIAAVLGSSTPAARMLVLAARRQVLRRMGRHLSP